MSKAASSYTAMRTSDEMTNGSASAEMREGPVTRRQRNLVNGTPVGIEKFQQQRKHAVRTCAFLSPTSNVGLRHRRLKTEGIPFHYLRRSSMLQTMSLRKYVRRYDLREVQPYSSKLDLCRIVAEHLDSMVRFLVFSFEI